MTKRRKRSTLIHRSESGTTWKVTLPCTHAEAEQLKGDLPAFALLDTPPTLITSEANPADPDEWRLDAYFEMKPDAEDIALLRSLLPVSGKADAHVEQLGDEDWVTLSQQGLEPIRAGRFVVHTPAQDAPPAPDVISLEIEAGRAFGTGHHQTTTGCLLALDRLKRRGANFSSIVDLGTGTGLLAFAALRLWPCARIAASDIDPIAIEVAEENARINSLRIGRKRGAIEMIVAAGLRHRRLKARMPYDLIIANILAGPLIALAPTVASAIRPSGILILAGLLDTQADRVLSAYRAQAMMPLFQERLGDWPTLVLRKRHSVSRRARPIGQPRRLPPSRLRR